jgi:uncharacterized 2Fe-2S/4Fe-4S cluster protein (DUF4445 family)
MPVDVELIAARYELANEWAKQLIALSTGVIALTVTFLEGRLSRYTRRVWALKLTWAFHLISIMAGVMAMGALTGELAPIDPRLPIPETIRPMARLIAVIQFLSFLLGTLTMVAFGLGILGSSPPPERPAPTDEPTPASADLELPRVSRWHMWRRWASNG